MAIPRWAALAEFILEHHPQGREAGDPADCDICRRVDRERRAHGIPSIFD